MPHFTAIALDRLIDPGASKSADKSIHGSMTIPRHPSDPKLGSSPKLERRNSTSSTQQRVRRPQMTPALYATPETTPLPDSPSSFPPSPYIINHKRRGPRLLKNTPEANASSLKKTTDEAEASIALVENVPFAPSMSTSVQDNLPNGTYSFQNGSTNNGDASKSNAGWVENLNGGLVGEGDAHMPIALTPRREGENEDFYDPQESMSCTSNTEMEECGTPGHTSKIASSAGEFYDAWEELSTDSAAQSSLRALEDELRELRLSLLMEIEKRKQAEDALLDMQSCWQRIREQLSLAGLTLPANLTVEAEQLGADPIEDLAQQVHIARIVSEAIGSGIARAEAESVMEAQLEAKNFEIARMLDRLHYYEAVNHEMSQRNQEAIETAR